MITPDGKRKSLGRGLSALLGDEENDYARLDRVRAAKTVAVDQLRPGRTQPRRHMGENELGELSRSIAARGVLQPLLVRRHPDEDDAYEIIAGERRWRAAQMAQLHEVPVIVKELSDGEALEVALVENLQRQDLSPLEEAEGYRRLMEEFSHTQDDLARTLSKSRSHIANLMRLLGLPDPVKALLEEGAISAGHARALLTATDPVAAAEAVTRRGLSVRQTENMIKAERAPAPARPPRPRAGGKEPRSLALEYELGVLLGLAVEVETRGAGGSLTFHFRTLEQLDELIHRLQFGPRGYRPYIAPDKDDEADAENGGDEAAAAGRDDSGAGAAYDSGDAETFEVDDDDDGEAHDNGDSPR